MDQAIETLEYLKTASEWSREDLEAWAMALSQLTRLVKSMEGTMDLGDEQARRGKVFPHLWNHIRRVPLNFNPALLRDMTLKCRTLIVQTLLHLVCWAPTSKTLADHSVSRVLVHIERLVIPTWAGKRHHPRVEQRLLTELERHLIGEEKCLMNREKVVTLYDTGSGKLSSSPSRS